MLDFQGIQISWLGHASFKIETKDKIIFIDPYDIETTDRADYIFITHIHHDHFSLEDIENIKKPSTIIVATSDCAAKLGDYVRAIKPDQPLEFENLKVQAIPAYNTHHFKSPGVPFHPKESNWVGFILEINNVRIYHAGDTDKIPEMENIQCDIAMLPVGGTYTMDAEEAAQVANQIKPDLAIPMHWGKIVGTHKDARIFSEKSEVEVRIMGKQSTRPEKHFVA